jgi:hypothetical protein
MQKNTGAEHADMTPPPVEPETSPINGYRASSPTVGLSNTRICNANSTGNPSSSPARSTNPLLLRRGGMARLYTQRPGNNAQTSVEELFDLMEGPAWMTQAACKNHPEVTWFPRKGGKRRSRQCRFAPAAGPLHVPSVGAGARIGPSGHLGRSGAQARTRMLTISRKTKMR